MDTSSLANQKKTVQTFLDAYNAWDLDAIIDFRAPDCQHHVLPLSLGRPALNNDEFRKYFGEMMTVFSDFKLVVHTEVHDGEARKCVMHASSTANTKIGEYANEYVLILTFTEDGKKVAKLEEFVDSAYSQKFFVALKAT